MIKKLPVIILAILWSVPAFAAHPLMTDDTGTQGRGKFQLELNGEHSTDHELADPIYTKEAGGSVAATLTYGITDDIDLVVDFPWQWSSLYDGANIIANDKGISDTSIELKWKFFECKPHELSLALKPIVTIPTGDEQKGLGNGRLSEGEVLIATKEWENRALHFNAGFFHNSYGLEQDKATFKENIWHTSLAAEVHMTEKLRAVADFCITSNTEKAPDPCQAFLLGGLIYSVANDFDLDIGIKAGLNHAETDKTILAGLTARF